MVAPLVEAFALLPYLSNSIDPIGLESHRRHDNLAVSCLFVSLFLVYIVIR
jgi:hypothetical protein